MARKCTGLKLTPARAGSFEALRTFSIQGSWERPTRGDAVPSLTKSRLDRLKRAHAFWRLDRLARSLRNILPSIALIVGGRSPCAGGAGAGGAIVVALQRNAEAFVHCGLRGLRPGSCRRSEHGQRGGEGTDDGSSADDVFRPHGILLSRETGVGRHLLRAFHSRARSASRHHVS